MAGRKKKTKNRSRGMSQKTMQRRASMILNSDKKMIRRVNGFTWKVRSQSDPEKWHTVKMDGGGLECSCDYCQNRKKARCVHGTAVEMRILQTSFRMRPGRKKAVVDDEIQIRCPNNHADEINLDGHRGRKYRDAAQLRKCKTCGARFTWDPGFAGRHHPPDVILSALWLFCMGNSPSAISVYLEKQMSIKVHKDTVDDWANAYMDILEPYTGGLPTRTGGIWTVDEKMLRAILDRLSGIEKKTYLFTMFDALTRFLLAFRLSEKKDGYNANELFKEAKERAGCVPAILKSDKLASFKSACSNTFQTEIGTYTLHWCDCHMRGEFKETNGQERANSTVDSLVRSKRSIKSYDSVIVRAAMFYYNFLRPHSGIDGKTPAEAANIIILGGQPLKTLIQNAVLDALDAKKT